LVCLSICAQSIRRPRRSSHDYLAKDFAAEQVSGANLLRRCLFDGRGSRYDSAVSQLPTLNSIHRTFLPRFGRNQPGDHCRATKRKLPTSAIAESRTDLKCGLSYLPSTAWWRWRWIPCCEGKTGRKLKSSDFTTFTTLTEAARSLRGGTCPGRRDRRHGMGASCH